MNVVPPNESGYAQAAAAIRNGEIVAYPTETVYGLGVDPFNEDALAKLFRVKGRDASAPILLIVDSPERLEAICLDVSHNALACMRQFWPGPLSLLLPKKPILPDSLTAGSSKVCVRCPGAETARAFCSKAGGIITSTSANLSGQPPATSLAGITLEGIAMAIDGGALPPSPPSTVFDPDQGVIIRHGAIADDDLKPWLSE
ncbi:MAG: threonylcarbamoyl-AMP synthase [Candidatus Hydrogenedentes bacterium]|nr:threonylcarbamoyl-AMP synthase [Candidatus Hydrogenedentota bacterium]